MNTDCFVQGAAMFEFVKLTHSNMPIDVMKWHVAKQDIDRTLCSIYLGWFGDPGAKVQAVIRSNELPLDMCKQCFNLVQPLLLLAPAVVVSAEVTHTPPETVDHLPLSHHPHLDLP